MDMMNATVVWRIEKLKALIERCPKDQCISKKVVVADMNFSLYFFPNGDSVDRAQPAALAFTFPRIGKTFKVNVTCSVLREDWEWVAESESPPTAAELKYLALPKGDTISFKLRITEIATNLISNGSTACVREV